MKKLSVLFLALALMISFAACSILNSESENQTSEPAAQNELTAAENESSTSKTGKTLVVYFSASGNTKAAAEYIADAANADLFELVPKTPYTADDLNWRDENSRVNYEHENEAARNTELVSASPDGWEEYDTVFIGYPIWWGIAAWPVDTFVKTNNFTGKAVIPFCTSTSSGLGESGELLKELAESGNWIAGKRFSSDVSSAEVWKWFEELNIY